MLKGKKGLGAGILVMILLCVAGWSRATCVPPPKGTLADIIVKSCEAITASDNEEVKTYAGDLSQTWKLEDFYTGALVTDANDTRWMYSTKEPNPCKKFPMDQSLKMRRYFTCCDLGRWGKCVFQGHWLGDVDGESIDTSQ